MSDQTPMLLSALEIQGFKRIQHASFGLSALNVLVGGNNAGKTSLIQGLHYAISILQSMSVGNYLPKTSSKKEITATLNATEIIYSPTEDSYALAFGGQMRAKSEPAINFKFTFNNGKQLDLDFKRGRNRNVRLASDLELARLLSNLETPFSIFSPGLAGIAKSETWVSDGPLLRALARGDANLFLRNTLYRLWKTEKWLPFLADLREIFPSLDLRIDFEPSIDENIVVRVQTHSEDWVPLELAGTGLLQAMQILSYIHRFLPRLIVLDEPDSHLHPNNQRLICALLRRIAQERQIQIILATHSRHVVDALSQSAEFLWVRNGEVDRASDDDEIGVLMDLGALDVKERMAHASGKAIVLTEDALSGPLKALLLSNGFVLGDVEILPYKGVTKLSQLRPLIKLIRGSSPKQRIMLHRDRDFMKDEDVEEWVKEVRKLKAEPYISTGIDVEASMLDAEHLAYLNDSVSISTFQSLLDEVSKVESDNILKRAVNGTVENERQHGRQGSINHGQIASHLSKQIASGDPDVIFSKYLGTTLAVRFQSEFGKNLHWQYASPFLVQEDLVAIAKRFFGSKAKELTIDLD